MDCGRVHGAGGGRASDVLFPTAGRILVRHYLVLALVLVLAWLRRVALLRFVGQHLTHSCPRASQVLRAGLREHATCQRVPTRLV